MGKVVSPSSAVRKSGASATAIGAKNLFNASKSSTGSRTDANTKVGVAQGSQGRVSSQVAHLTAAAK